MASTRQSRFEEVAGSLGHAFDGNYKAGGDYVGTARDGNVVYVSGQVPRVGDKVLVMGRAGAEVTLADAQTAAKICAMRGLSLLAKEAGGLDKIRRILKVCVYTQSTSDFTRQSEVADAASQVFHAVLGDAGMHTRTSVGVFQLPKNATVEVDLVASVE
jgi:enamine deaminase RidA (YjgF/YER057c/UK114 family)